MRELPSLHTNVLLNSLVFQQELDRANANRDRQIYPVLSPGPDPGTSILDLKVKDRLPIHVHADINNYSTPNTPELRANFSLVDNNLWQLNHQLGLQYSFSPEAYKQGDFPFYDQPLIANYSAYYRMPLGGVNGRAQPSETALSDFGYNEATRRFKPPAATGASELLFYASRSSSDTGTQLANSTLTPPVLPPEGGLQISDDVYNRTINPNEDLGVRFTTPIKSLLGISSTLSLGLDYKNYRSTLTQSRTFQATIFVPDIGTTGPPFTEFPSPAISTERETFSSVVYLPFAVSWDANETDSSGNTTFSLGQSFNFASWFNQEENFEVVASSAQATGDYYVLTPALTREQKLYGDWGVRLHADGQWANQPLISNEQIAMGGLAGPRGYRDGAEYGDTGWRISVEPHSPYWNMGLAFDKYPIVSRVYTFVDYGQRYLLDAAHRAGATGATPGTTDTGSSLPRVSMLGTGAGVDVSIGEHFDCRVNFGMPMLDIPGQEAYHPRIEFSIGMQW
jgi:hemolysin activation/secretion protein